MIRLKSVSQALSLKGQIPDIAVERMVQFADKEALFYPDGLHGSGKIYDPEIHGYLIIIEDGDDVEAISEAGERGLLTFLGDGLPPFEYVSCSIEGGQKVYEAVMLLDNERTIAFIVPESVPIDGRLRQVLEDESILDM